MKILVMIMILMTIIKCYLWYFDEDVDNQHLSLLCARWDSISRWLVLLALEWGSSLPWGSGRDYDENDEDDSGDVGGGGDDDDDDDDDDDSGDGDERSPRKPGLSSETYWEGNLKTNHDRSKAIFLFYLRQELDTQLV